LGRFLPQCHISIHRAGRHVLGFLADGAHDVMAAS
jgi:hypothetical protein